MTSGIAGIDHVIVAVRDLEAARRNWRRLGFTVTPRGRHIGQGTANYCIMFGRDYLELLGFVARDDYGHRLEAFLAEREGPMSVAFAPERDAESTRAVLAANGLHPSEPRALGRALELPEGNATPRFSLLNLPPEETPGLDCFICGHLTPELVRRPEWLAHANGVVGIKAVHILADDSAGSAPAYRRVFGDDSVAKTAGGISVGAGRNRLLFSSAPALAAMPPAATATLGIDALELTVESRTATGAYLTGAQVAFMELPDGRLLVHPSEATGATLFFSGP